MPNSRGDFKRLRQKTILQEIVEKWENIPCDEITVHLVQKYLIERANMVSNNSFNVYRKEGRRLFEWGKKQGLIPRDCLNPFAEIEKKPHQSGKIKWVRPEPVLSA